MDQSADTVKTVVGKDLYGYMKKQRLESLLQELFGRKIDVFVSLLRACWTNITFIANYISSIIFANHSLIFVQAWK
jgi:uncharacterized membrane protein